MKRDILYVDDELDNLIVFEATFETDFNVVTTTSGREALELLEERSFPIVIADQRMPVMTGAQLFEVLRRTHPHTKRIMLTGYADSKAMIDAINQGQVYYFIKKPWEREEVFAVLVRAMEAYDLSITNLALTNRLVASDRCAALGRSAARIAHEMGNQLCLLPLLELIEEQYGDHEDLIKTAAFARKMHERLLALINEVKSFVRFEQEGPALSPLPLGEVMHELLEFLRYDNSLPLARLGVRINSEPTVRANKIKLQQVLVNLLKNAAYAIKDREDGRIQLVLDQDAAGATIQVSDNGAGMTPEVAQRIWEPFFTTKGEEGTGLGLDVAKGIIEAHGGTITCDTAPGQGAAFTIRVPLLRAAGAERGPTPAGGSLAVGGRLGPGQTYGRP